MALFKKKLDPVSERAKAIDQQIAALEAEIKKLSQQPAPPPNPSAAPALPTPGTLGVPAPKAGFGQPRLRSTALPHRVAVEPTPPHEPIFEELNQPQIKADTEPPTPANEDLGTRKSDLSSWWQRFLRHFHGPVTSNPKLVNYLAAGSIQGLQPLRYEKRVARNRFIFFALVLGLVLWGLIVMFSKR
jgi:hypothetical protein